MLLRRDMRDRDIKFYTIPYQNSASHNSTFASQHPIFIFPGISGNKIETLKLGEFLNDLNEGKRLVNIYTGNYPNLNNEAKSIADILSEAPSKRFHFLLVGYSYGCTMAVLVAQHLQALGHIPHLVLIDSPAPAVMKNYFTSSKDGLSATEDIVAVMQYVAKLSSLETVTFDNAAVQKIAHEAFIKRVDSISKYILDHQNKRNAKNAATFKQHQDSIKQKLQNLLTLEPDVQTRLSKINLLLTDKTAKKFNSTNGGWDTFAEEIHLIPTDKHNLSNKEHTQLLVDETSCATIAKLIHEIFIEDVLLKEMNIFLADYSASHKDTSIDYDRILNKLKKQLSEKGLLISFREKMNMEGLDGVTHKSPESLKTISLRASQKVERQHFGLFCNDIPNKPAETDSPKENKTKPSEQAKPFS